VAYWLLAKGHDDWLHSPVTLNSFRQNFCDFVKTLNEQKDPLRMLQTISSDCAMMPIRERKWGSGRSVGKLGEPNQKSKVD